MNDAPSDRFSQPMKPGTLVIFPAKFDSFSYGTVQGPTVPGWVTLTSVDGRDGDAVEVQARNCVMVREADEPSHQRRGRRRP
jgi:hypothetical protein